MQQAKLQTINAINDLPDNVDMKVIMYRLYVIDKHRKGQDAANQGHVTNLEELEREISSW